jgi:hypothetical protein
MRDFVLSHELASGALLEDDKLGGQVEPKRYSVDNKTEAVYVPR